MGDYKYSYEELTIELTVGGKKFERVVPNFTLISKRNSPVKILIFEVGNVKSPAQGGLYTGAIEKDMEVTLTWGFPEDKNTIFKGKVTNLFNTKTVKAIAKDKGVSLFETITVTNTRNETTSQIVKRLVSACGLNPSFVSTDFDVVFQHFNAFGITVQEALLNLKYSLKTSFGKDTDDLFWWVDNDGNFHFGTYSDEKNGRNTCAKSIDIDNKKNLIELEAPTVFNETGRVFIAPWPYFDHSMEVKITDDRLAKISGKAFRIDEVRHIQESRRARTELFIREL